MAVAHRSLPHFGVQFHPESVATGYGPALLRNFRDLTARFWGLPEQPEVPRPAGERARCAQSGAGRGQEQGQGRSRGESRAEPASSPIQKE